jgi:hypothetical protein
VDTTRLDLRRLTERVLAGGALPLPLLLEVVVPVRRLRDLARRLGLSPVGFRTEKAPARLLASMLAELREPAQLDDVLQELLASARRESQDGDKEPGGSAGAEPAADAPSQRLKDQELERARGELERARQGAARALERESELRQSLERRDEEVRRLRAELDRRRLAPGTDAPPRADADRELVRRVRELEQEVEARAAADEALRRQLARDRSRIRELEDELAELEPLVPRGRRQKKAAEPPPAPERRFLLPWFLPSFYRSLDGKERKSVERALQAILLFCTEGHSYPGLEVKQLGGHETWSLRASLGLRVYFRHRDDGDVEIIELADREEQHTTLRRLKER